MTGVDLASMERMDYLLMIFVLSVLHINGHVCTEIIGGKEAAPHTRPYMALLGDKERCAGTLIKPNWILTAAYCNSTAKSFAILGAHRLADTNEQQKIKIKRVVKHPCYDLDLNINNLQLLELESPAKMSKSVNVLSLPGEEPKIDPKKLCSVAGWGLTDVKKKVLSDVLREANLTVIDNGKCQKLYKKEKQSITNNMICAGPPKRKKDDACDGDYGGPLICDGKLAGVVSFGPTKCKSKLPGVYTRLTITYLKWIRTTIGGADDIDKE
ncbi:granzyme A-like [Engystomops pustulosus]|uniref:granzyme A-like n=1 Tax=Engystomops pustulosus TaxID=76066 RepID=UPI003AFA5DE1